MEVCKTNVTIHYDQLWHGHIDLQVGTGGHNSLCHVPLVLVDYLHIAVRVQSPHTPFPAKSAFLVTREIALWKWLLETVYPNRRARSGSPDQTEPPKPESVSLTRVITSCSVDQDKMGTIGP
jgi:hypothetical protein